MDRNPHQAKQPRAEAKRKMPFLSSVTTVSKQQQAARAHVCVCLCVSVCVGDDVPVTDDQLERSTPTPGGCCFPARVDFANRYHDDHAADGGTSTESHSAPSPLLGRGNLDRPRHPARATCWLEVTLKAPNGGQQAARKSTKNRGKYNYTHVARLFLRLQLLAPSPLAWLRHSLAL